MSQEETIIGVMNPELKSTLQRDIIAIFQEKWRKDQLTFERIREILIEKGQLKNRKGSERWLRENLKHLRDCNILIDIKLPHKKTPGRPARAYKWNEKGIYELFKLTENLVDAMGFAQVEGEPGKAYVSKIVIKLGREFHSLRTPPKSGEITLVSRIATEDDLEKTWRLAQHIKELQNYCQTDSPAYKEYELKKEWEIARDKDLLMGKLSWEEFRDGFQNAEKSENGIARTERGIFVVSKPGKPALEFKGEGPLYLETDNSDTGPDQ